MAMKRPRRIPTVAREQEKSSTASRAVVNGLPALSEKRWQAQVVTLALLYGWSVFHVFDSRRSQPGFPDLVLVKPPTIIFAELKTHNGKLRHAQVAWLDLLLACPGVQTYLWRPHNLPDVQRILEAA